MLHHIKGFECPLCNDKLKGVHPNLANIFRQYIKPYFEDAHISWGYRGKEDQEQAFREGSSNAHYPESKHNNTDANGKPCSLAIDIFKLSDDQKQALYPPDFYDDIADFLTVQKQPVKWGATFKVKGKYKDANHFELAVK